MSDEQVRPPLPEAPASATLSIEYRGYNILFTLREHDGRALLKKFDPVIDELERMGAKPAIPKSYGGGGRKPSGPVASIPTDGSAPLCPTHNKPMRMKDWGWACGVRDEAGNWCKAKAR